MRADITRTAGPVPATPARAKCPSTLPHGGPDVLPSPSPGRAAVCAERSGPQGHSQPRPNADTAECALGRLVLFSGDSPERASALAGPLQDAGYDTVVRGSETPPTVPVLLAEACDLLLIDVRSASTPGLDLARAVRGCLSETELPILILGIAESNDIRAQALAAGANDFITAAADATELLLRVKNLAALSRLQRAHRSIAQGLGHEVAVRSEKLATLIESGLMMSMERDRSMLLRHILAEGQRFLNCDCATMYLVAEDKSLRFALRTKDDDLPSQRIPLHQPVSGRPNESYVSVYVALRNESVVIDDVYKEERFDLSGTQHFDAASGYRTVSMVTVPMAPRGGDVIGVLQFINAIDPQSGAIVPFPRDQVTLVEALAAQAAVALDNLNLVESQKGLIESIIRVIATAIDAKSPYTGRHCERVPELAFMLAAAACEATEGPLADFAFRNEDEWQEFRIGAWLHDCGKVITPEHVIDKATKLEMIYNRIHEVRMRFEVLLRDLEIARLHSIGHGTAPEQAAADCARDRAALFEDFAFVADCNVGVEAMDGSKTDRLRRIAQRTWLRHFDDRLGLSLADAERIRSEPSQALPATEFLLVDRPRDIVPRTQAEMPDAAFGFRMDVPANLYNHGELYNLSISRGTLNAEERYKINEHMVHTIMMLERIPFPEGLRRVPEYAGTHHETMDGSGYPRRLAADRLSVPSRVMAIADIFEALTAADRPYKTPKKLSEALAILRQMQQRRHIDTDLFNLFLTSGIYLRYAQKHLRADQIDVTDIRPYLAVPADTATA
jgi:HD-GYP domain-containing protein (c-di-GMP phosphodiesterase class II)